MDNYLQQVKNSKKLQLIISVGLIIQVIFCITAVGSFHSDQHFQIIEFSSFQLKEANATENLWEKAYNIRPTFQVYAFSFYQLCCRLFFIDNPFHQLTVLRIIQGVIFFITFNLIAFFYCSKKQKRR